MLLPFAAFAAYNDVSLGTNSTVLSVGGYSLTITGSTALLESITVDTSTFSAVLQQGSTLSVKSADHPTLAYSSDQTVNASFTCETPHSRLDVSYNDGVSGATTVTVTVSGACTVSGTSSSSSSGSSAGNGPPGGGGGGGGGSYTPINTPAPAPTATVPAAKPTSSAGSGLSATQIEAILGLLQSFDADASVISNVRAALSGTVGSANSAVRFLRNLEVGSKGEDVRALQQYLNSHGFIVAPSGDGSSGHETSTFGRATKAALIKYQKSNGIAPAVGYFGPKTRTMVNAQ